MSDPAFDAWLRTSVVQIHRVQELMEEPLSDDRGLMISQLSRVESWGARLSTLLSEANAWLDIAEHQELMAIDRELTVLERSAILKSRVAQERKLRDTIAGLCDSIKTRISLGQSILRNATKEASNLTA